jgi:hypothetical protein
MDEYIRAGNDFR